MAEESTLREESISEVSTPAVAESPKPKSKYIGSAALLGVFALFVLFIWMNFHIAVVDGISMLPTLKNGRRLTVSNAYWLVGPIKDNDIVVVRDTGRTGYIVKRVYKLGGETVDYANSPRDWSLAKGKYVVPDGYVYVLGDNREHSEDSRAFGPRKISEVIGKVVLPP